MSKELSERGYFIAASDLGVDVATIKAVAEVESAGDGFTADGRVKILFERHKFHSLTQGQFDSDPDISNRTAGGYGAAGAHQYARFSKAFALDADAAMKSASWGKFQIMGFNHKAAGFDTVGAFVDAMKVSEDEQLKAFVNVIKSFGLAGELRNHDWAGFARQYNGMGYKKNRYDTKMAKAYEKFKGGIVLLPIPDPGGAVKPDEVAPPPDGAKAGEPAPQEAATTGQAIVGGRPNDPAKQVTQGGGVSRIITGLGGLSGAFAGVKAFINGNNNLVMICIICTTLIVITFMFRQVLLDLLRMKLGASPDKYNVS